MRQFALFLALAALLFGSACVDTDGDGVPDAPPGVGDDDGVGGDDDNDPVATVAVPLSAEGCDGVVTVGLQVAVTLPEGRSDGKWQTPSQPPTVGIPADGDWRQVSVYVLPYTLAHTFVRVEVVEDGTKTVYQADSAEGDGIEVDDVVVWLHYNFSTLCGNADGFGNAQCSPQTAGDRWYLDFNFFGSGEYSLAMGAYTPQHQEVTGFGGWSTHVDGCTAEISDSSGSYELEIDPIAHEVIGSIEGLDVYGNRL